MTTSKKNFTYEKNTKVISTLGPSTDKEGVLEEIIKQGVNVVRLNMSHGDFEEQGKRIKKIKELRVKLDLPLSILLDTKGPEIRIHDFKDGKQEYKLGSTVYIEAGKEILGDEDGFSVTYQDLPKTTKVGEEILCDDGKLSLTVKKISGTKVECLVNNTFVLNPKKAVNIPGAELTLPFVNEYDKSAIEWGLDQGIEYIAASFVNSAEDVKQIKEICVKKGYEHVQVISKIESLKSVNNLNEIILESDGIMLARGDLGVEIPFQKVPFYQGLITNKCKYFGKPIIIATQMLESMSDSPRPTRSEVTDVYFAANSGVDATMLSGETAAGDFPIPSVNAMSTINKEAETNYNYQTSFENAYGYVPSVNADVAYKVARTTIKERIDVIIALSSSGSLIKALSKFRPRARILGVSNKEVLQRYFGIWYGVYMNKVSVDAPKLYDSEKELNEIAKKWGSKKGDRVLIAKKDTYKVIVIK